MTSTFYIDGMCCATEEQLIRKRIDGIDGIEQLDFDLIGRTLRVQHELPDEAAIVSAIRSIGMTAVPLDSENRTPELPAPVSFWRRPSTILTIISGVFGIASEVLVLAGHHEGSILTMTLAVIAIVTGGYQTAGKAWAALRTMTLNIHFLMSMAVIGAMALGEWTEAAVVIFLFAVAEIIEDRSTEHARRSIRSLMELTPDAATVLRGLGWDVVPADQVERGELVRVKPGERLPLDGVVRHGESSVDQSPITGESMPVGKTVGDRVFAGSINGGGTVDYAVTHTSRESTISRIIELVEHATSNRGPSERFIDRFARYYTPSIFAVAVVIALAPPLAFGGQWHEWIYRALVILVIGCPCALVISTPVTIVSGLASAARRGILIKGGAVLERGRHLRGIAFDKTGTLTRGRPRVTDVETFDGLDEAHLLHLAAAVEARSEHPIAQAIVAEHDLHHQDEEEIPIAAFSSMPGRGIQAEVEGRTIFVGNHRLAHDLDVCSEEIEAHLETMESDGKTTVVVMSSDQALGVIGVADSIREETIRAVDELHQLGLRTAILTGDNIITARSIAGAVGIDDMRANLLPEDKMTALAELEREHGAMGMVGDGVNDAPALAQASIGFAMGAAGTDVALETADVALMEDNLLKLPEFIRISQSTIRLLWQNVSIALGLKFAFFALALTGEATLWMAVFADMGASLIVVFNGLRLLRGGAGKQ